MKPTPDARLMAVHNKRLGQWTLHDMRPAARGYSRTVAAVLTGHDPEEDEAWAYALANRFNQALSSTLPIGTRVRKRSGSEWQGRVVGHYSTSLTPDGVAVESESHAGSVQIYPVRALEVLE